jgi:hypothetical protein
MVRTLAVAHLAMGHCRSPTTCKSSTILTGALPWRLDMVWGVGKTVQRCCRPPCDWCKPCRAVLVTYCRAVMPLTLSCAATAAASWCAGSGCGFHYSAVCNGSEQKVWVAYNCGLYVRVACRALNHLRQAGPEQRDGCRATFIVAQEKLAMIKSTSPKNSHVW